jgi:hypothetical protein
LIYNILFNVNFIFKGIFVILNMWNYKIAPKKFQTLEITKNPNLTILLKLPSQHNMHFNIFWKDNLLKFVLKI